MKKIIFGALAMVSFATVSSSYSADYVPAKHELAAGPFKANWESLAAGYQCPDWFRDAKFGIWAHWTAQCVPEQGDWYARNMYIQGSKQYEYHVKNYGHPSKFGFMELDNLWKAENWDPEKLMALYKRAGAKYFVALANHHDNFDAYDSKYHAWNSMNVGPKKDIVGTWAKVARANGLRFGVTNHSAHAWHWFQPAYGYDPEGPMEGVRYDAATLTKADGKGKWWEGLDPQDLYTGPNIPIPDGIKSIKEMNDWHVKNDRVWHEDVPPNNPAFVDNWFLRCQDLVDKYHPDLLYFDDTELPLEQAGLDIAAHFYNASIKWNGGQNQAVVNAKKLKLDHRPALVEDYERGFSDAIQPAPWQTDTCIGDWHYSRETAEKNKYKTPAQVERMLVDIVSKNGNLLLDIPVRGDGTIDDHEVEFLQKLASWMDINSEGIFGSRPWKIFGEGPTQIRGGMFNENKVKLGAQDIRFTVNKGMLYAYFLGWPEDGKLVIHALGKGTTDSRSPLDRAIKSVRLLGSTERIDWKQEDDGLHVNLPATPPGENVFALRLNLE